MRSRARLLRALAFFLGERREKTSDWAALPEAVRGGAAYLAQGSSYAYLRARAGFHGPRLFADHDFGAALERCKWETFAVAAQDLLLMIEIELRGHVEAGRTDVAGALQAAYRAVLEREAVPAHRVGGWGDVVAEFEERLGGAMAAAAPEVGVIGEATAERLMATAPIEAAIRVSDTPMVTNNVLFRFVDYKHRLRSEIDFAALAAELEAGAPTA